MTAHVPPDDGQHLAAEFLRARLRALPMPADIPEELQMLKAEQVAKAWGVGKSTIYELAAAKVLPSVKLGTAVRFPVAALYRWIDQQVEGGQQR
jgi:excisionase family DNA binding protein